VTNPIKVGNVIKYTVKGQDKEGFFEAQRRFNEFYALRKALHTRWPGCYVPSIPEKTALTFDVTNSNPMNWSVKGNMEGAFVEERRALLERFLKELSRFDYIVESKEFKLFSRGPGEVDKQLEGLPTQTPMQILEKYRLNFKLDEDMDNAEKIRAKDKISSFTAFLKKSEIIMEAQKNKSKTFLESSGKMNDNFTRLYYALMKFEDTSVDYFSDGDVGQRTLTHPNAGEMKTKVVDTINQWKNPFAALYIWLKGEVLDIKGMMDAMTGRETVMKHSIACDKKKRENTAELEKLQLGKTTMKSFFKSKSSVEKNMLNLQADIESATNDLEDYRKLINFITLWHGTVAIDNFKRNKIEQYEKMLNSVAMRSI